MAGQGLLGTIKDCFKHDVQSESILRSISRGEGLCDPANAVHVDEDEIEEWGCADINGRWDLLTLWGTVSFYYVERARSTDLAIIACATPHPVAHPLELHEMIHDTTYHMNTVRAEVRVIYAEQLADGGDILNMDELLIPGPMCVELHVRNIPHHAESHYNLELETGAPSGVRFQLSDDSFFGNANRWSRCTSE
jgi:hypothetical protein